MSTYFEEKKSELGYFENDYTPQFFRLRNSRDKQTLEQLIAENKISFIHDEIEGQLRELVKSQHSGKKLKDDEYKIHIDNYYNGSSKDEYGVWVFYSWSRRLVHVLDEDEFIKLRTNRNQYKITPEEQDILSTKKIGIIGLSVGQSIALTLAMERGAGELVLADFDLLELSNLNRIRSGVHNLGVHKAVMAAREIVEIDPFLKVTCFMDGITEANMDDFFLLNGKLDLLIEECDSLDMKILVRLKARELGIPVLMDTSDRGMLDVERFDIEMNRPILHGLIENINAQELKSLSNEDKVPFVLQMLGVNNVSVRGKASMIEIDQSISTWPQLASSVTLGAAVATDVSRRIFLNQFHDSGRYYLDLDELVANKDVDNSNDVFFRSNPFTPLSIEEMKDLVSRYEKKIVNIIPDDQTISGLVNAACLAPSTGNDQPWKWLYSEGVLFLFHDEYRSNSFGDFQKIASFITFGAAYENLYLHAITKYRIQPEYHFFPLGSEERLVAAIHFNAYDEKTGIDLQQLAHLDCAIPKRHTNRNLSDRIKLDQKILDNLSFIAETIDDVKFQWFTDESEMSQLSDIIGACDRIRLLNDEGHYDFVNREMRWTEDDAEKTRDGIDIQTLGLNQSQLAALQIIKNPEVIKKVRSFNGGGKAFEALAKKSVASASALCLISLPKYDLASFFEGGRSMERFWLAATNDKLAVHPLISPLYLFPRILHANAEGISEKVAQELAVLRKQFQKLTNIKDDMAEVFLAKVSIADEPILKALRLPIEEVLFFDI